jgi:plasmid stabilization system protein ParE
MMVIVSAAAESDLESIGDWIGGKIPIVRLRSFGNCANGAMAWRICQRPTRWFRAMNTPEYDGVPMEIT